MTDQVMELCNLFTETTGLLCTASEDLDGEVVINTGVRSSSEGLIDMETEELLPLYEEI